MIVWDQRDRIHNALLTSNLKILNVNEIGITVAEGHWIMGKKNLPNQVRPCILNDLTLK